MKPWDASQTQIKRWIREAAFMYWLHYSYRPWIDHMQLIQGWSEQDAAEFLKTHNRDIREAFKRLNTWLNAEDEGAATI